MNVAALVVATVAAVTAAAGCQSTPRLGEPQTPVATPCDASIQPASTAPTHEVLVSLTVDPAIADARMEQVTGELRGVLGRLGLDAALVRAQPKAVPVLLDASTRELRGLTDAAAADRLYGPLRSWLRSHSRPARDHLELVIVGRLAPPGSLAAQLLGSLGGLALTRDACRGDAAAVCGELANEEPFTPTVFLALDDIAELGAHGRWTAAHEVAHALGLTHSATPGNLMTAQPAACLPHLDPTQLERLRSAPAVRPRRSPHAGDPTEELS